MNFRSETGFVLVLVLIFLTAISMGTVHLITQGSLNLSLLTDLQGQLGRTITAENEIRQPDIVGYQKPLFIPDHLGFGCEEGVWLSEIVTPFFKKRIISRSSPFVTEILQTVIPNSHVFKNIYSTEAKILDLVFEPEGEVVYVLWDRGKENRTVLMRLDRKTASINAIFELPFIANKGWLTWINFSKFEKEQRFLLLSVVDEKNQKSRLMIFLEPTVQKNLIPLWMKTEMELGIVSTRGIGARLSNGEMIVMVVGKIAEVNYLTAISLMGMGEARRLILPGDNIRILMAANLKESEIADKLYYADQNCLWALTLESRIFNQSEAIVSQSQYIKSWKGVELNHAPLVVPDVSGRGVRLYITGQYLGKSGLFLIQEGMEAEISLVYSGDYLQSLIRFGELWLIPRRAAEEIILLQLPYHQRNMVQWRCFSSVSSGVGGKLASDRAHVEIKWDLVLDQEMVIILNNSYELTTLVANPFLSYRGLIGWQRNIV